VNAQPGILSPLPAAGKFLTLSRRPGVEAQALLEAVAALAGDETRVVGLGEPLAVGVGRAIDGLHAFRPLVGKTQVFPSTQGDLWVFQGGRDPGEVLLKARALLARLAGLVRVDEAVAAYVFDTGRDLTGYEDGTENPTDARAVEVAVVPDGQPGLAGGSFVAVQRWVHDLAEMERLAPAERDLVIGRHRESNEEIADAPGSAHVKRTAQEGFTPPAFLLRRSMPYGDLREHGLYFVAYGASLDPFERILSAMAGHADGVPDALLRLSRPVTGGCYFCPPVRDGRLDLRAFGR
jgi:putative iron-dependent peroxidase